MCQVVSSDGQWLPRYVSCVIGCPPQMASLQKSRKQASTRSTRAINYMGPCTCYVRNCKTKSAHFIGIDSTIVWWNRFCLTLGTRMGYRTNLPSGMRLVHFCLRCNRCSEVLASLLGVRVRQRVSSSFPYMEHCNALCRRVVHFEYPDILPSA